MPRQPLDAAVEYVALGLPVIPLCSPDHAGMWPAHLERCQSPGKAPILKLWTKRGVPTPEEIDQWRERLPNANLGLILGSASGLVGIDVDGETGERLLEEWSAGELPPTWEFRTGAGRRLLYAIPGGLVLRKQNQAGPGEHEELALYAEGQQTVVPPSVHPSGRRYRWEPGRAPEERTAAAAPSWIVARMNRRRADQRTLDRQGLAVAVEHYSEELLARAVEMAPAGGRNNTGIWLACQLRDSGLAPEDAWEVMQAYTAAVTVLKGEPYTEEEARHSLEQAFSRLPRTPWRATVLKVPGRQQQSIALPSIAPMSVKRTRPPVYTITFEGRPLRCSRDQLLNWAAMKVRIFEEFGTIPHLPARFDGDGKRYPPQTVWEMIINDASPFMEELPAPDDASVEGMVWEAVCQFLLTREEAKEREGLLNGQVLREGGCFVFRTEDLNLFLETHKRDSLSPAELCLLLEDHGATQERPWIKGRKVRLRRIPCATVTGGEPPPDPDS